MKKLIVGGLAALALGLVLAPAAQADVDCYNQTTYGGNTRTTCYSGYPDYHRTVIDCDATHCVTRGHY